MRSLFVLLIAILVSVKSFAGDPIKVDQSSVTTTGGIGGYTDVAYAFAKGDKVTIDARASKPLERMLVTQYPNEVLGRVKSQKKINFSFTMPENGIVIFHFVSDRGGSNKVDYSIQREPASEATQQYNTKVEWQKPADLHGQQIPVQVK